GGRVTRKPDAPARGQNPSLARRASQNPSLARRASWSIDVEEIMRIAIVTEVFLPKIDGVVNRTLNLIRHLPSLGDELLVVCPRARGCPECPVPVIDVPSFSFLLYPEYRIGLPDARLAAALKRFNPDVIHFVNPFAFGFRCHDVLLRAGLRVPTVFSFHTLYGQFVKH